MRLKNKKAIVTGAGRSIGQAIALAFAKEGADLCLSYHSNQKGIEETVQQIEQLGRRVQAFQADFLDFSSLNQFYNHSIDFLGHADILVNNAAAIIRSPFLEAKAEDFDQLMSLNVKAPFFLMQKIAKQMIDKKIAGHIINISSIGGERVMNHRSAYSCSKGALNMLTKAAALELAPYQICVNGIAPGATASGMNEESPQKRKDDWNGMISRIPLNRAGKPEDYTEAAIYLASGGSSWTTGQILTIDGGHLLSF